MTIPTEHAEQSAFVAWFRASFKDVRIFAIPNGSPRNIVIAQKLKLEGVSPGVPDLFIPAWRLWIEFKRVRGGTVSTEQDGWMTYLSECGYVCFVARGCEDGKKKIEDFIKLFGTN